MSRILCQQNPTKYLYNFGLVVAVAISTLLVQILYCFLRGFAAKHRIRARIVIRLTANQENNITRNHEPKQENFNFH